MRRWFLLAWAFLPLGCAGVEIVSVEPPRTSLTVREARKNLRQAFSHAKISKSGEAASIAVSRHGAAITMRNTPNKRIITFAEVSDVNVEGYGADLWQARWRQASRATSRGAAITVMSFQTKEQAVGFSEALLSAKQAAVAPSTEEADFTAFRAGLGDPRPEISDDARANKAVAEDAFQRKDFVAALYAYGDALDKHPMWPEGQYNAALLAAEVEDFELAAHHMRRYLALAPDAKDAAAAKEKFLLWKKKAGS